MRRIRLRKEQNEANNVLLSSDSTVKLNVK